MTANGPSPTLAGSPRNSRVSSHGVLDGVKPGASRRASRGFFSLFSSKRQQKPPPQAMQPPHPNSSFPPIQPLSDRFDAISLTSPSQRNDPAFSRDVYSNQAHPVLAVPRDFIRTSAPVPANDSPRSVLAVTGNLEPATQQPFIPPQGRWENNPGIPYGYVANYYNDSQASQSSLTLPSNDSSASSYNYSPLMSPSSSTTFQSYVPTSIGMPPDRTEAEDSHEVVASPVADHSAESSASTDSDSIAELKRRQQEVVNSYEQGLSHGTRTAPVQHVDSGLRAYDIDGANLSNRPMSPPPEYEPPRPIPFRTDSAPELRYIQPPGLPHRSATAPIPAAPPATATAPRRPNDRRAQAYDLDRIDELDESNPLGVALHHEGPFQAIASVLKGPSALGNQPSPPHMRAPRPPKPGNNGGSLGISPGQVLPRNFPYYQPVVQPTFRQDYNNPPQASTSYLPPQPQFAQQYGQNNMHASPVPKEREPRWSQPYPGQPPSPAQPVHAHPSHDPRASYIPQTQYDPMDPPPQPQNGNPYYPDPNPPPPGHHVMYASEDSNSDAYGGIEVDLIPKQERYSAPPAPPASQMQVEPLYAPQNGGANGGFDPRRHSVQAGHAPPPDPRLFNELDRLNAGQNLSNIHPSHNGQPVAGFIDPRISQNRDQLNTGQNLSGMRHSPNGRPMTDSRLAYPAPPVASQDSHLRQNELDRRRIVSYQPQPTAYNRDQHPPIAEHDPRRRASYQPAQPPSGAAPADFGRHQFERSAYQQQQIAALAQDRPQSVIAPSIAGTANTQRHRLPQHTPKHLVMPTPLQQSSQLPNHASSQNYHAEHYSPNSSQVRLPLQQAQPTRAQTIQMVQDKDGGRHLLRKRTSAVQPSAPAPPMPPKVPPVTRQRSYMEPPPTMPEPPTHRQMQQEKKRPKRLLSKRRTDL